MLNWLRKLLKVTVAETPATNFKDEPARGFFSMDRKGVFNVRGNESLDDWARRMSPLVFQKTIADVSMVQAGWATDGALEVKPVQYAMDADLKAPFNNILGGAPLPANIAGWYAAQSFIGYQFCALLLQHWFIDKACSMPARDAFRNGYDITRDDGEKLDPKVLNYIQKLDKKFKVKKNLVEAVRKKRGYGIRVILFEVSSLDPDYYTKPFNIDGITPGSYKGISQVDPYWITPELNFDAAANPASIHFYEPTYWRINGVRYHRTHLIVLLRNEVPDVLKPTYFYGGIPLPQQIYERVYAAERTTNEGPQLALTKRLTVIEGVDMVAAMANPQKLQKNIDLMAYYRDNYGVHTLGAGESLKQVDTALADVDTVIMTQWQIACAIAEIPSTKALGLQAKGGIGNQGEYEEASYHEMLESIQEHDGEPILERHYELLMRSHIVPKFQLNQPIELGVRFSELDAETAKEFAERTALEAERDLHWAQSGAIDGVDIRQRLINDKESGYTGIEEVMPPGPDNRQAVQPGAPIAAPNTQQGTDPTPAPATTTTKAGDALDAAVLELFSILAKRGTS